ncbi:STY0301 family protein [Massilia horti]|uniref:Uncharacterized protein n=1 Tax=Massilia horti TaxID=2562153 RepID=A0A4Y9T2V9_9BURK|nr:STY0301 family protein [Massilia horti]TFW33819.1 hypothetical protein E4O92_05690 [Massilia horti]
MIHPTDIQRIAVAALVGVTFSILGPGIARAEQHIVCPPQVDASQITVTSAAGWRGLYRPRSRALLSDARVWIGPLNEGPGELIGETIKGKNGVTINRFPSLGVVPVDSDGVLTPQDKWMVCAYGDGNIVQAVKLPEATKQCDVIYRRVQDPLESRRKLIDVLSDIVCK